MQLNTSWKHYLCYRVIHVDCWNFQFTFLEHLVQVVYTSCCLLRNTLYTYTAFCDSEISCIFLQQTLLLHTYILLMFIYKSNCLRYFVTFLKLQLITVITPNMTFWQIVSTHYQNSLLSPAKYWGYFVCTKLVRSPPSSKIMFKDLPSANTKVWNKQRVRKYV